MSKLFFSMPLAGYGSEDQWDLVTKRLSSSLQSIRNSTEDDFEIIITGHEKPDIEELQDSRVTFIEASFAKPEGPSEFRRDKSRKVRSNLKWIRRQGGGDVFLADADDNIHRELVEYIRKADHPYGHVIRYGYVFDAAKRLMAPVPGAWRKHFNDVCGSSNVLRFTSDDLGPDGVNKMILGPHSKILGKSAELGRPLNEIDWPAAVYVLGTRETISVMVLRTPKRQSQLQRIIEKHSVELTDALIRDFSLGPLVST